MRDWDYLTTAPNQVVAEMMRDSLVSRGVPAMLQPEDTASYYGVMAHPVRIMVAKGWLDTARSVLAEWEEDESEGADDSGSGDPPRRSEEDDGR